MSQLKPISALWAVAAAAAVFCSPLRVSAQPEDYRTWPKSVIFKLNTDADGADVPGNLYGFPVLVRLGASVVSDWDNAFLDGGADIRFAKGLDPDAHLPFEIEYFSKTGDTASIWVRVDTLFGGSGNQFITMYYGAAGKTSASNGAAVFNTSNGFAGVWHLGEDGAANGYNYSDATSNNNDGAGVGLDANTDVPGMVGRGQKMAGGDYINVPDAASLDITGSITLSGWYYPASIVQWGAIIVKGTDAGYSYSLQQWGDGTLRFAANGGTTTAPTGKGPWFSTATITPGNWYFVAATYDGANITCHVNGQSNTTAYSPLVFGTLDEALTFGADLYGNNEYLDGTLDELRVSNTARSADWLKACYRNQKQPQDLVISLKGNVVPSDITLDNRAIDENRPAGTFVGQFTTADVNAGDGHTYTLVSGTGDNDNGSFSIGHDSLFTAAAFNFETRSAYSIRVRSTDDSGASVSKVFTIAIANVNEAPTGITLNSNTVESGSAAGTPIGRFAVSDPDAGSTHTLTLPAGGANQNASFRIRGDTLVISEIPDIGNRQTYQILVRATDAGSGSLFVENSFSIFVLPERNAAPDSILLGNRDIEEALPSGTLVGLFTTADVNTGDGHTYALATGTGDGDNGSFSIGHDSLFTAAVFNFETRSSYSIRVRSTDDSGASVSGVFTITVTDVNEAPTGITLSSNTVESGAAAGTAIGTFAVSDPDAGGSHTLTLPAGGADQNASFTINGSTLIIGEIPDYLSRRTYEILVRASDTGPGSLYFEKRFSISVLSPGAFDVYISVDPSIGGTTVPAGTIRIDSGGSRELTAAPAPGFAFVKWTVNSGSAGFSDEYSETSVLTLSGPGEATVTAGFEYSIGDLQLSVEDVLTNDANPSLSGTVNDPHAVITVACAGDTLTASNLGGGTWQLPRGGFSSPLPEDTTVIYVTARNPLGVTVQDSGFIVVDATAPVLAGMNPDPSQLYSFTPTLLMTFSEAVYAGSGQVRVVRESDNLPVEAVSVPADPQSPDSPMGGFGSAQISVATTGVLELGTRYYVLVDGGCFLDAAGNAYSGIASSTTWSFLTRQGNEPEIDSVTSLVPDGVYKAGDTVRFAIWFSAEMTLQGGDLHLTLETGGAGSTVSVPGFVSQTSVTAEYIVRDGDMIGALDILILELAPGAVLANGNGTDLLMTIDQGRNLSDRSSIALDGIPPKLTRVSPLTNETVRDPEITYVLGENAASGTITWRDGILGTALLDETKNAAYELTGTELDSGRHTVSIPQGNLVRGAWYRVDVQVFDEAGNGSLESSLQVKLTSEPKSVRVVPGDTSVSLGDVVRFNALGVDDDGETFAVDSVEWTLKGMEKVQDALFRAADLGEAMVIAGYGPLRDTSFIHIGGGVVTFPPNGSKTIVIGGKIRLEIPPLSSVYDTVIHVAYLEKADLPSGFKVSGPIPVFTDASGGPPAFAEGPVLLKLRIDTAIMGADNLDKVQLYVRPPGGTGPWSVVYGARNGVWLEYTADSLGAYMAAVDTVPPRLEWLSRVDTAAAGTGFSTSLRAEDNIANPQVRLRVRVGGGAHDSVAGLRYKPGTDTRADVDAGLVTTSGLFYAVEAWDGANLVSLDTVDVAVTPGANTGLPEGFDFPDDSYHLFSVPLLHDANRMKDLLLEDWGDPDDTRWRLFLYDGEFIEMSENMAVEPGRSYWLRTRNFEPDMTLKAGTAYTPPVSSPFEVTLLPGWNCISTPFLFNLDAGSVHSDGQGELTNLFLYENNTWLTKPDIPFLEPWKGYVTWNGSDDSLWAAGLAMHPLAYVPASAKGTASGRFIRLTAENGASRDGVLLMGYDVKGSDPDRGAEDHLKPPMFGKPLDISLRTPWSDVPYLSDLRPGFGEGQAWTFIVRAEAGGTGTRLLFEGLQSIPENTRAVIFQHSSGRVMSPEANEPVYLEKSAGSEEFDLLVGTDDFIAERIRALKEKAMTFSLGQNFPNPFSGGTRIIFSIPYSGDKGAYVSLQIFDMSGRLVRDLVKSRLPHGLHEVFWDGRGTGEDAAVPGTYLYRIRAGEGYTAVRKMVLMKR